VKRHGRLTPRSKVKPLAPGEQLAPYEVPSPPPGKFRAVPGQLAMDFESDEWDALIHPDHVDRDRDRDG
jgi:hypothetical protein